MRVSRKSGFLTLTVTDNTPEDEAFTLFAWIIGKNAIAWAELEHCIDLIIDAIYIKYNGHKIEKIQPATSFNKKLSFLRRWQSSEYCLHKDQIDFGIEELRSLSQRRNDLIHGKIMSFDKERYGIVHFRTVKRSKDIGHLAYFEMDFKVLEARAEVSLALAEHFTRIFDMLLPMSEAP